MPLQEAAKKLAQKQIEKESKRKDSGVEGDISPSKSPVPSPNTSNKYSDYNNPPKESAGEFPGDYADKLMEWEKNLSPEDKIKLRQKRAQENNINLDR